MHECFFTARGLAKAMDIGGYEATYITNYVHTSPAGFGKIMSAVKPRLAVYSHIIPPSAPAEEFISGTRKTYTGPLEMGEDLMTIEVGDEIRVRRFNQ